MCFEHLAVSNSLKINTSFLHFLKQVQLNMSAIPRCMVIQYITEKKRTEEKSTGPFSPSFSLCPVLSVTLREELRVCVHMCMCVHECVCEVDRFPTWKWLAIIRCSVTRGYVRQLKLCFLTETWFMLLVVTVTTSKRDRNQTQTKAGEINADSLQPFSRYPLPFNQGT